MTGTIGFLGVDGSYSHQAASIFLPDAKAVGYPSFDQLISAVETGEIHRCALPIENSSSGRIPEVHRLLSSMELFIVAEHLLPVEHVLVTAGPCDERDIHTIFSHPQGFIQTSNFLTSRFPDAARKTTGDTATAVKEVVSSKDKGMAAIGSEFASKIYDGMVLYRDISNRKDNITRFVLLSDTAEYQDDFDLTTLILQVGHEPGSLVSALSVFGNHDVNITKLETYMVSETTKLPTFYLDIGCGSADPKLVSALDELQQHIKYYKFLGSYKADTARTGINGFLQP